MQFQKSALILSLATLIIADAAHNIQHQHAERATQSSSSASCTKTVTQHEEPDCCAGPTVTATVRTECGGCALQIVGSGGAAACGMVSLHTINLLRCAANFAHIDCLQACPAAVEMTTATTTVIRCKETSATSNTASAAITVCKDGPAKCDCKTDSGRILRLFPQQHILRSLHVLANCWAKIAPPFPVSTNLKLERLSWSD